MNDTKRPSAPDATAPQALAAESFSWSGFTERGIIPPCVPIPAYATQNQRACAVCKSRPLITSRRNKWRNSLWSRRFWCPSFRPPVHARPPNRFSISSRSRHRSMLSPCRARANTDYPLQRQDLGPASASAQSALAREGAATHRLRPSAGLDRHVPAMGNDRATAHAAKTRALHRKPASPDPLHASCRAHCTTAAVPSAVALRIGPWHQPAQTGWIIGGASC